jgi:hypothetical protein
LNAVVRSLREGQDLLTPVLQRDLPRGAYDKGYVLVEPWQTTALPTGKTPYFPGTHRITLRYTVLPYGTPTRMPSDMGENRVIAWQAVNSGIAALAGHRAGERVRLLMSPDIAQSLMYGTPQHQRSYTTHVRGTPGHFDVTIERVCEPQIWTLFRGGGPLRSAEDRDLLPRLIDRTAKRPENCCAGSRCSSRTFRSRRWPQPGKQGESSRVFPICCPLESMA